MKSIENFVKLKKIEMAKHQSLKEQWVQNIIENHPELLGLGNLQLIKREKHQCSGGRLDFLMEDDDETRYTIEIQLGKTDPSHIIRAIEYWDKERNKNPNIEYKAVIIAEDITTRFFNVINLFGEGRIPIIAIKMTCVEIENDKYSLLFTKIIDKTVQENVDDDRDIISTDRKYWLNRSNDKNLNVVDEIFKIFYNINESTQKYELKYNKFYIGICKNSIANNFIYFKPNKQFVHVRIKSSKNSDTELQLDNTNFEYKYKDNYYDITVTKDNLKNDKDMNIICSMMKESLLEFDK